MEKIALPYDERAERAVCASCMTGNKQLLDGLCDILTPDDFFNGTHQRLFKCAKSLHERGAPVDVSTVMAELSKTPDVIEAIGGNAYVKDMASDAVGLKEAEHLAEEVRSLSVRRQTIDTFLDYARSASNRSVDIDGILDSASRFTTTVEHNNRGAITSKSQVLANVGEFLRNKQLDPDFYRGLPSPVPSLNVMLCGGLKFGEYSIVGARPSMGKTAFALALADEWSKKNFPVLFFSAEMTARSLGLRLLALSAGVPLDILSRDEIPDAELEVLLQHADNVPDVGSKLYIDDSTNEPTQICRVIRRAVREFGIRAVVVDYIQLLYPPRGSNGDREQQVAQTSRMFKNIAKELDIHLCALAQLNRTCETREDKKPMLSDLRESGSLEQDADVVMFLWRPEYYGIQEIQGPGGAYIRTENYLESNVAKHRNGPTGPVDMLYDRSVGTFVPWAREDGDL